MSGLLLYQTQRATFCISFSVAGETDDRSQGLNSNLLSYSSIGWKSGASGAGLNQCQRGCGPFWRFQRRLCPLSVPGSRGCLPCWVHRPLLHFQRQQCRVSLTLASIVLFPSDHSQESFSIYQGFMDSIEPSQIMQPNLPISKTSLLITSAKPLFAMEGNRLRNSRE